MNTLSTRRFGQALGGAFALSYLGCALVMAVVPRDAAIRFFNSLMHGLDVTPIVRWDIPLWETALGLVEIFILGWLFGAVIAALYNLGANRS